MCYFAFSSAAKRKNKTKHFFFSRILNPGGKHNKKKPRLDKRMQRFSIHHFGKPLYTAYGSSLIVTEGR